MVAAPAYLDRHGTPDTPGQLRGHRCIIDTNFRDPHQWTFRGGLRVPVAGPLAFSNASACLAAAEAGLGIACLPDFVAEQSLEAGHVRAILAGDLDALLGIFALYPSGRFLPAKVRVLVDFMARVLKDP